MTFHERLRDLCQDHGACHGQDRTERIHAQAEQALALAVELGCLRKPDFSWEEFLALCPDATLGTEHMVELDAELGLGRENHDSARIRVGAGTAPPTRWRCVAPGYGRSA